MRSLATNACGTPHRDAPPRSDDPSGREMGEKKLTRRDRRRCGEASSRAPQRREGRVSVSR